MPLKQIDYSKTHFYKIICKNTNIKDIYVGHTTDFKTRKGCHKRVCNNSNDKNYNLPLYKFIRENEGWDNFDMILIETVPMENSLEARKRERELIEELHAEINYIKKPAVSPEEAKQRKTEWTKANEDQVKEYKHNWQIENRERLSEIRKQQYQDRREEILAKCKKYYEENIEERRAIRNRLCQCSCGDTYTYANKSRHERTKKHQDYINSLQD